MYAILAAVVGWAMSGAIGALLVGAGLSLVVGSVLYTAVTGALDLAMSMIGGVPSDILALSLLFGWGEAVSILGAALITRVGIVAAGSIIGIRRIAA